MTSADTVLILTHGADHFVIERVAEALAERGVPSVRFDTDRFPLEAQLATRIGPSIDSGGDAHGLRSGTADGEGAELDLTRVRAVWARKLWTPRLPDTLEPRVREGCLRESRACLLGWLAALDGVRWVNSLGAATLAENKPRQLRLARAAGLRVPRTLVTNDPAEVRAFAAEVGEVVAKMLTPLSISMEKAEMFVHTTRLGAEDLAALDGLRFSPMVFQELVPKALELRVACVGARAFTGAIDASHSAAGSVDWRLAQPGEARWTEHTLAAPVAAALRRLLDALGLAYGAADLIVTPAGEHVFLELNPGGEWGMLERDLGLPIGAAIAEELLSP
jgi:glutathione synthase/RimK-type ligase-like ATP-grasp enzyme